MPEIKISKIKARRGTDDQRKLIVFDQGELAHTLDTTRLYVGDGVTLGGKPTGSKIFPYGYTVSSMLAIKSEIGDVVPVEGTLYQLTSPDYSNINSWTIIGRLSADPSIFSYDANNQLVINLSSIKSKYLDPTTISNGIKIDSDILQLNYDTGDFTISTNKLKLAAGGVTEVEMLSSSFGLGLSGGSGSIVNVDLDTNFLKFNGNFISLKTDTPLPYSLRFSDLSSSWFGSGLTYSLTTSSLSTTLTNVDNATIIKTDAGVISLKTDIPLPYSLRFTDLSSSWFGSGLTYSTTTSSISTTLTNVDNNTIVKTDAGVISLSTLNSSGTNQLPQIVVDTFGRVTSQVSSIYGTLSGNSALSSFNSSNSLSALFNGSPSHTINGPLTGVMITQFTALSSNGSVITLSSAGFITFEGNTTTRSGQQVGRFAIPIFAY